MQYIKGIDAFREEKRTAVTLGKDPLLCGKRLRQCCMCI